MNTQYGTRIKARSKPIANGRCQTDVAPNDVLDIDRIAKDWASHFAIRSSTNRLVGFEKWQIAPEQFPKKNACICSLFMLLYALVF